MGICTCLNRKNSVKSLESHLKFSSYFFYICHIIKSHKVTPADSAELRSGVAVLMRHSGLNSPDANLVRGVTFYFSTHR